MKLVSKLNSLPLFGALIAGFIFAGVLSLQQSEVTSALSATDFKAGRIIDDAVFYNKDSMNAQQIQDFLNRLIPNCDTWGTSPSEYGGGTRAQYAASRGWHGPPYACLNNYHENPSTHETSFEKGGGAFAGGVSAAQIIYNAAQQYGISPKVLLVMLKKESAGPLTADTWPLKSQYKYAMGYACPDSGPGYSANCDAEKSGFYNQMMLAAWQLKYYRDHPNDYRYFIGTNNIQYSPDPGCGTKSVNIENIATLSLYIYTPYTPNAGALANYPGTAPCGAYGNRNFFMFFNEWFGSTYNNVTWDTMVSPRVMVLNQNTMKVNANTLSTEGDWLPAGSEIIFESKTTLINGEPCLRTRLDTQYNQNLCVLLKRISELNPVYTAMAENEPAIFIKQRTCKVNLMSITADCGQILKLNQEIQTSTKTTIAGVEYYITKHDSTRGNKFGIRADRAEITEMFNAIPASKRTILEGATVLNPYDGVVYGELTSFTEGVFDSTITIDGETYLRSKSSTNEGLFLGVPESALSEDIFIPFINPRKLQATTTVDSVNPFTKTVCLADIPKSSTFFFSSKIKVQGVDYFRTENSTKNSIFCAIPAADLTEV